MTDPIKTDCLTTYKAFHSSGIRDVKAIKWVVLHDTEGGTAKSIAEYFASPKAGGSAHLVVDDKDCYRTLANEAIPWGAPGANTSGFHVEQCGFAKWSAVVWTSHRATLQRAAYKAAYHCHLFGIPPTFLVASDLREGAKGVTTHAECTKAFGGDHTDPGRFWPRWLFMRYLRGYYDELGPAV